MDRSEVVETIKKDVDAFLFDLNDTCIRRNKVRDLHSIVEYFKSTLRPPVYKNIKRNRIYLSENLKDLLSDENISPFMQAACNIFIFDTKMKDFYEAEIDYCQNNEIPYVREFQKNVRNLNKETILVTRHVFPEPYVKYFEFDDYVSNKTIFDSKGNFKGFYIPIRTGEDKLKAAKIKLREKNLTIGDCAVMVDGVNDIPLVEEALLSISSALSNSELKDKVDYHIKSFEDLGTLARML